LGKNLAWLREIITGKNSFLLLFLTSLTVLLSYRKRLREFQRKRESKTTEMGGGIGEGENDGRQRINWRSPTGVVALYLLHSVLPLQFCPSSKFPSTPPCSFPIRK
jgi:hypothetical protein